MPLALAELLAGASAEETKQTLVNLLAGAGFPVSSWQEASAGRAFVEAESISYADLVAVLGVLAGAGFLSYAERGWLTLLAREVYSVQRKQGTFARGKLTLTDAGGIGPITLTAGDVWVSSAGVRFYLAETGTLPASGGVSLIFAAEHPGARYNVGDGGAFALETSLPGVTVATTTPPGGTWLSAQGTDEESDEELRVRCRARWGELGYGATEAAYRHWALTASDEVTRVSVLEATGTGVVAIRLAGAGGPVSSGALDAVAAYLAPRRPLCVQLSIASATVRVVPVAGTVYVKAAYKAAAQAAAVQALARLYATIPIGGVVYQSQVISAIHGAAPGVVSVVLTAPSADIALGASEVATLFTGTLSWQAV